MLPILAALGPVLGVPAVSCSCPPRSRPAARHDAGWHAAECDRLRHGPRAHARHDEGRLWLNLTGILLIFTLTYLVFIPALQFIR